MAVAAVRGFVVVAVTIAALAHVPPAVAYEAPARLNDVARVYSLGEIRCDSQAVRCDGAMNVGPARPAVTAALVRARAIGDEVDARYPGLRVTETSSTAVIESLTLFDGEAPRIVPADRGIYYAVCPNGATCPYPGRAATPATALAPRRVALELALRTFVETSADLVVVSLPTRRFTLLVVERDAIDFGGLAPRMARFSPADRSQELRSVVDAGTLAHLYVPFGLYPTASGRDSLLALPLA
jgi:hypothetical protein